ncbi:MAG: sarcosine oxidase subunit gamma family protein, partial [Gammaproteobacteria bacterium]|nr:sarcosine oxidase subunit gamma family protein [Gammaproteobacteria bacterium]
VTIRERRPAGIAQVHGSDGDAERDRMVNVLGLDPKEAPARASATEALLALWNGPGSWLAVSDEHDAASLVALLSEAFDGSSATVTDLSHARTVIELRGPQVRDLLAKGCPMDVDAMTKGDTAATLLGPFTVQIHCREDDVFDVYAMRSFGLAAWEMLIDESRELGGVVEGSAK